jgi:hypothetical protein
MKNKMKEKLGWFQVLTSLYELATPHIGAFTGIKCKALEERIIDIDSTYQSARTLRQLFTVIKNMPEPPGKDLMCTKKHFETALSNCINASDALVRYAQTDESAAENQKQLDSVINSILLAREYVDSTYKRLNLTPEKK